MYRLVFLRHGRSQADDEKRYEGRYDSPLTDIGIDQAKSTASLFKDQYNISRIISSPLKRARQTAEIIASILNVDVEIEELLIERDNGILAGVKICDADRLYPKNNNDTVFSKFYSNSGENEVELNARALLVLNKIMNNVPGNYLVVSHGNILNAILKRILNIPIYNKSNEVKFIFRDNGYVELQYNETCGSWMICKMQ